MRGDDILEGCLEAFAHVRLTVTGDCMRPALAPGDVVLVAGRGARPPRRGEIVLCRLPAGLRLHRLVWTPSALRAGGKWRTKADGSASWDPPIAATDVLGTVIAAERGGAPVPAPRRRWRRVVLSRILSRARQLLRPPTTAALA